MSTIGNIFTAYDLERAVIDLVKAWMPAYLGKIERLQSLAGGSLPIPRSYEIIQEFDSFAEEQIPKIIVISPGTAGEPIREGDGTYKMTFILRIGIVVSASTRADTSRVARLYAAAVRTLILQHKGLGIETCDGLTFIEEAYDSFDVDARRTIAAATLGFEITIRGVSDGMGTAGDTPPIDPSVALDPYELVEEIIVDSEVE